MQCTAERQRRVPVEDLHFGDHRIRYLRPAHGLESFVRCYAHRTCCILEDAVVHPVHARAAPVLDFVLGGQIDVEYLDGRPTRPSPTSESRWSTHRTPCAASYSGQSRFVRHSLSARRPPSPFLTSHARTHRPRVRCHSGARPHSRQPGTTPRRLPNL